jgi:hypothetical protein
MGDEDELVGARGIIPAEGSKADEADDDIRDDDGELHHVGTVHGWRSALVEQPSIVPS